MALPQIQGYRIVRELGQGGMAVAYLAVQELFERLVALKVMTPSSAAGQDFAQRFMREARIIGHLSHPNIVPVYEVAEREGQFFFSMEFLPGGDLASQIDEGLKLPQVIHIVSQIARALDYAHTHGVIHRDVKPDNILFRSSGEAVLTDFGIARDLDDSGNLTVVETVVGSPRYMSPEQARGDTVDTRSDLFSLGVVMYEMVTGDVPFNGSTTAAIALQHVERIPLSLPPDAAVLQQVLTRMTALDPDHRYPTALALVDELDRIGAGEGFRLTYGVRADAEDRIQEKPTVMLGSREAEYYRSELQQQRGRERFTRFHWSNPVLFLLGAAVLVAVGGVLLLNSASRRGPSEIDAGPQAAVVAPATRAVTPAPDPILKPGYYLFESAGPQRTPFQQSAPSPILMPTPEEVYLYSDLAAGRASITLQEYTLRYPRSVFTEVLMIKEGDSRQLANVEYRAAAGEEAAQLILSELADSGWIGPEDPDRALALARQAARHDYALGHYQVATILMQTDGNGEREATVHLQKAADDGLFLAMNTLADIYWSRGGAGGQARALALYRKSAGLGDPEAMFKAGKILWEEGATSDARFEALSYLQRAADEGHVNAQLMLHEAKMGHGKFPGRD